MSEEEIKVVKTASCPSLSGRSTITYDIGSKGDSQYIRLSDNSSGGIFCKDWVSLTDIQQLLTGLPSVTSKVLKPLYAGKSSNSPGFLAACVIHEKLHAAEQCPVNSVIPQSKPAKVKKVKNDGGS